MPHVYDPTASARPQRKARADRTPETSCDLLLTLCTRDPVGDLIGRFGVSPGSLLAAREDLDALLGPESADWRVRLEGRGGGSSDLEQLLAICRTAECHAYQLIEQCGLQCAALRREIIILLRGAKRPVAPPRGLESAQRPSSVRMARDRRPSPQHGRASTVRSPRAGAPANVPSPRRSPRTTAQPATATTQTSAGAPARNALRESAAVVEHAPTGQDRSPSTTRVEDAPADPARNRAPRRARRLHDADVAPRPLHEDAAPQPDPHASTLDDRRVEPQRLPPLEGRERDLASLCDALGRRGVRVPLLVGPPGSGRTLLACHVATHFEAPVFRLSATAYDSEETLSEDLDAIAQRDGLVIFDDLDRVPSEVAPPFIGALSHAWTRDAPRILAVVSPEGHGRLAAWLPGALQTADAIKIDPLSGAPLSAAVKSGARAVLEAHAMPVGADLRLAELTRWADRYLGGLAMPARALDLLDLACARAKRGGAKTVRRDHCLEIVAERSGLPPAKIEARGDHDVLDLEQRLAQTVVGHAHATTTLAQLIRRNRAGFGGQRPVLSTLLLGPSGVGKTELAKALATALFEDDSALFRLDMSEYSEAHAVARVVGAPPGYVGHEHGGALTDPLLRRPHCVVLLDEIEKAHRDVHQLLLQVFDEGRLTDGRGRTVDFRHAVLVMTSNLGAEHVVSLRGEPHLDEDAALTSARAAFPVELWNRIEAPLVMQPLGPAELGKICQRLARSSSARLFKERGIRYTLDEGACEALVGMAGRDPTLGARPLRHLLVREVESVIADAVLRGRLRAGTTATLTVQRGRFSLA